VQLLRNLDAYNDLAAVSIKLAGGQTRGSRVMETDAINAYTMLHVQYVPSTPSTDEMLTQNDQQPIALSGLVHKMERPASNDLTQCFWMVIFGEGTIITSTSVWQDFALSTDMARLLPKLSGRGD
jgi:hypothetical protein